MYEFKFTLFPIPTFIHLAVFILVMLILFMLVLVTYYVHELLKLRLRLCSLVLFLDLLAESMMIYAYSKTYLF